MIPPDVASALRLQLPDQAKIAAQQPQNQPVASVQQITDALSDLAPGQRILAEIQALLPNGAYRATVGQRDITLALPFSAKPGDTLELEVKESDGHLTLAFVTNRTADESKATSQESSSTSLSTTGKLIGQLIGESAGNGKQATPLALNGSQPLVNEMPEDGATLAPILKQALTQSGMFYEAHQARWVAGELPTEALKQEPQGKFPATHMTSTVNEQNTAKSNSLLSAEQSSSASQTVASRTEAAGTSPIPRELVPMVQQQLDGLANQNFAWQGQVWPGQQMRWEIGEDRDSSQSPGDNDAQRWQTRLKLSLPKLGDIDVALSLRAGGEVGLSVTADSPANETRLRNEIQQLRLQFEAAGLNLTELSVQHGKATE